MLIEQSKFFTYYAFLEDKTIQVLLSGHNYFANINGNGKATPVKVLSIPGF
jgi:hypothetical protein